MAIDFPNSPSPGDNLTVDGKTWTFTDGKWALNVGVGGVQGPTGPTGATGATGTVSLASPAFTGTPTAPTATAGTNTTQLATTEFVTTAAAGVTSGFRNVLINGGMSVWQRWVGISIDVTNGATGYTADRWYFSNGANQASSEHTSSECN